MQEDDLDIDVAPSRDITTRKTQPLKPLTQLLWPPEPDPSIFSDPLKKEDPKPLRHEELLRIGQSYPVLVTLDLDGPCKLIQCTATSQQLRYLLSSTSLSNILRIADSIPSPGARASTLSRLLGLDPHSLSRPDNPLLSQRDSPPPLEDLLKAFAGEAQDDNVGWSEEGWWLGRDGTEHGRVWIGEEERKLMRLFAGIVCKAIDGGEGDEVAWGTGGLAWEV